MTTYDDEMQRGSRLAYRITITLVLIAGAVVFAVAIVALVRQFAGTS